MVRGIADCNKMSENLNKARVDFRREMNALSEKSISNASARIASVPRRFELTGSLIRHIPYLYFHINLIPVKADSHSSRSAGVGCGYLFKYMVKFPELIFLHGTCSCCDILAMYLNKNRVHLAAVARRL